MKKSVTNKVRKWNIKLLVIALISMTWLWLYDPIPVEADSAVGGPKLAVLVDGRKVKFQGGDPVFENGRVQVPLRGIGEALKAEIGFSGKTVTYLKDGKSIALTLGSREAIVNGKNVTMDTAAKAVKGRTYVPLRFVSENLGVPVNWDKVGNWVWIGSKEVPKIEDVQTVKTYILNKTFLDLISGEDYLIRDRKDVRVFTIDDLPMQIGTFVFYDIWQTKNGNYPFLKARFNGGVGSIAYLQQGYTPRYRSQATPERFSDKTFIKSYPTWSDYDEINGGDKAWRSFRIENADYIAIHLASDSLALLVNPFN